MVIVPQENLDRRQNTNSSNGLISLVQTSGNTLL